MFNSQKCSVFILQVLCVIATVSTTIHHFTPEVNGAGCGGGYSQSSYSKYSQGSYGGCGGGYSQSSYSKYSQGSYGGGIHSEAGNGDGYSQGSYSSGGCGGGYSQSSYSKYSQGSYGGCGGGYSQSSYSTGSTGSSGGGGFVDRYVPSVVKSVASTIWSAGAKTVESAARVFEAAKNIATRGTEKVTYTALPSGGYVSSDGKVTQTQEVRYVPKTTPVATTPTPAAIKAQIAAIEAEQKQTGVITAALTPIQKEILAGAAKELGVDITNPAVESAILLATKGMSVNEALFTLSEIEASTGGTITRAAVNIAFGRSCGDADCRAAEQLRNLAGIGGIGGSDRAQAELERQMQGVDQRKQAEVAAKLDVVYEKYENSRTESIDTYYEGKINDYRSNSGKPPTEAEAQAAVQRLSEAELKGLIDTRPSIRGESVFYDAVINEFNERKEEAKVESDYADYPTSNNTVESIEAGKSSASSEITRANLSLDKARSVVEEAKVIQAALDKRIALQRVPTTQVQLDAQKAAADTVKQAEGALATAQMAIGTGDAKIATDASARATEYAQTITKTITDATNKNAANNAGKITVQDVNQTLESLGLAFGEEFGLPGNQGKVVISELARTMAGEVGGLALDQQIAAARVFMNRTALEAVKPGKFNVAEILMAFDANGYDTRRTGPPNEAFLNAVPGTPAYDTALRAIAGAMGTPDDRLPENMVIDATHYVNLEYSNPRWVDETFVKFGEHTFGNPDRGASAAEVKAAREKLMSSGPVADVTFTNVSMINGRRVSMNPSVPGIGEAGPADTALGIASDVFDKTPTGRVIGFVRDVIRNPNQTSGTSATPPLNNFFRDPIGSIGNVLSSIFKGGDSSGISSNTNTGSDNDTPPTRPTTPAPAGPIPATDLYSTATAATETGRETATSTEYKFGGSVTRVILEGEDGLNTTDINANYADTVTTSLSIDYQCDNTVNATGVATFDYTAFDATQDTSKVLIATYVPLTEFGTHCFFFTTDTRNVVREQDETNNKSNVYRFIVGESLEI